MKQMMKALQQIDFAIFTFAKSTGINDIMLCLPNVGVPIQRDFDSKQEAQDWSPVKTQGKPGVKLFKAGNPGSLDKVHHKLMVFDDQVVITGSFN